MAVDTSGMDIVGVVALLGAGVIAVPLFRRLGLGSVLGYFAAGLVIGPFGLGLFADPESILHTAEFGVIMLLFIIGLEMQPSRLWNLRKQIFGLGVAQVVLCGALLTGAGVLAGLDWRVAFVAGMGFVMSSTAVVTQMLEERGETPTPAGQQAISILLLEDLAIVPLLAIVAFLAPGVPAVGVEERWAAILIGLGAIAALVAAGRWLLNPLFAILAAARAREVMTAAALLVVLGAALLMELGGLSMAMGAFLAGVFLSESTFRHQLEADIEPFRGLLLGLFFLAVGMSLDLAVIAAAWPMILAAVVAYIVVKGIGIYVVARFWGTGNRDAITRVTLFAQGGEFAFVLYATATSAGIFDADTNAIFTATVIISMALTPFTSIAVRRLMPPPPPSMDGIDEAADLHGSVLIIGFGRFGQVVSQGLLARGIEISLIETDVEMIQAASRFGAKVYYGDGTRLDVLHASGAAEARAILVCVDKRETANRITALVKAEFPLARLFARSFDRGHTLELIHAGVDFQIRETFESAMVFGEAVLRSFNVPEEDVQAISLDVRRRDEERLELQLSSGLYAGIDLMRGNAPVPAPLTTPRRAGRIFGRDRAALDEERQAERAEHDA
jgi:glutathione-regulated potassium-efflux system protein KefB